MAIRLSQINHIQEDRAKLVKIFYIKTPTNKTWIVDVKEWISTREGIVRFMTKETNGFKIENEVTNLDEKEGSS